MRRRSSYRAAQAGSLPAHHHQLEASAASPYASPLAAHGTDAHRLRELQALSARMQAMQGEMARLRDGLDLQNSASTSARPASVGYGAPTQRRASIPASPGLGPAAYRTVRFQQTYTEPTSPFLANPNVLSVASAARRAVYGQGQAAAPPSPLFSAGGEGGSDAHLSLHNLLLEGRHAQARARASTLPGAMPASPRRAGHSRAPLSANANANANANAAGTGPGPCPFDEDHSHCLASTSQSPRAAHGVFSAHASSPAPSPFSSPAFGISDSSQIPAYHGSSPAVARPGASLDANGFPAMLEMPYSPCQAEPAPNARIYAHTQVPGLSYAAPFARSRNTPFDVFGGPAYQFPTPFVTGGMDADSTAGRGQQTEHPAFRAGFGMGMGPQHHQGFGVGPPQMPMPMQPDMGFTGGVYYPGQWYGPAQGYGKGMGIAASTAFSQHPGRTGSLFA